jgi:hypothetical protein
MEYKVLIRLYVPEAEEDFEVYVPINKTIYEVSKILERLLESKIKEIVKNKVMTLYDRTNGKAYEPTMLIRETDIRNGSEIIAIMQESEQSANNATTNTKETA